MDRMLVLLENDLETDRDRREKGGGGFFGA